MDDFHPIRGQQTPSEKVVRARDLRQEMTRAEQLLWQQLRLLRSYGYPFRRQQLLLGFIADFYCHRARLIVEVDGGVHQGQGAYDAARDVVLIAHGLRILRVTNEEVEQDIAAVMLRIREACGGG